MNITAVITILYLAIVLAIGYLTSRKKGGVREFLVAGGQIPWMLLIPFFMAEYISGGTTVGIAEKVHADGVSILWYYLGTPIGLGLLAFGFAKFYQSIKRTTVGEAIALLFGQRTRLACVIIMLLVQPISSFTASLALGTIVAPLFGLSYNHSVWASAAFLVILAIVGLRGQAWMNVIHLAAILVCFGALGVASVRIAGGWNNLITSAPPEHISPMEAGLPTIVAWITSSTLIKLISLTAITAVFAARNETTAKVSAVSTGVLVVLFACVPALMGLSARVIAPGIESKHALWTISEHMGTWAMMMASVGVIAAIISTTPITILALGGIFTRDILLGIKPHLSEKEQVRFCRIAMAVITFAGTGIALYLSQAQTMWGIITSAVQIRVIIVVPLLFSVLWRRIDPLAAFSTVISGVAVGLIWLFLGNPYQIEPLWPILVVGLTTLTITSLVKKPARYRGAEGLELGPASDPRSR